MFKVISKEDQMELNSMLNSQGWSIHKEIIRDKIRVKMSKILEEKGMSESEYRYLIGMIRALEESMLISETTLNHNLKDKK